MAKKSRWEWVGGDVDFITFGGYVINHNTNDLWYIEGMDFNEPTREIEVSYWRDKNDYSKGLISYKRTVPAQILVYRACLEFDDPLNYGWVEWDKVLSCMGESQEPKDIPVWQRIMYAAEYYGWDNFDSYPVPFNEGLLRKIFRSIT